MTDQQLADALRSLGQQIAYPPTPDLTGGVVKGTHPSRPVRRTPRSVRLVAVAAMLVVVLLAGVLVIPETRSTVAGWFGVPGIGIWFEDVPEDVPVFGEPFHLGELTTLDAVRSEVGFDVLVPDTDLVARPDEVYILRQFTGNIVSFVYHADESIPETEQTGVGILLTQFVGDLHQGMYGKGAPEGVVVEELELNGLRAYWISGEPHTFYWSRANGGTGQDRLRMAGNTLLWQDGDITLRLESALDRDAVLAIAASMK